MDTFITKCASLILKEKVGNILDKDGIFHIEVAYLPEIIKTFSYDTFCQEHYEYYSLMSLNYLCEKTNMKIIDFGFNDINGGSIWINLIKKSNNEFYGLKSYLYQVKNAER